MNNNKYFKLFATIFITGIAFCLNYIINLVLTPFITENVSTEAYGFVSLAKNFAQYATIITIALNSFATRYIALDYHRNNKKSANVYFSSVFYGDMAIGSLIFVFAILFTLFIDKFLNVPFNIINDVKLLFIFTFLNFWITTVFTAFAAASVIENKLDIAGAFRGVSYIAEALGLYILFSLFKPHVFYVGIGLLFAALVIAFSNLWLCKKYTPDLIIKSADFSFDAIKTLVLKGIWNSVNSIGNMLNSGLDLIVCNLLLSPLAMGQIAIAKTIDTVISGLYHMVAQAFQPMFLKSYAQDKNKLIKDLKFSMKISGFISGFFLAAFIALGILYFKLWIPSQDINMIYKLTVITVIVGIVSGPMTPLYYIYTLTAKNTIPCFITIIGGIANVLGMYFLIKYTDLGVYAVVLTTTVVMGIINLVTNPLYMCRCLEVSYFTFYPVLLRHIFACGAMTIVFVLLSKFVTNVSWLAFIIAGITDAFIGLIIYCVIMMNKEEKMMLKKFVISKKQY